MYFGFTGSAPSVPEENTEMFFCLRALNERGGEPAPRCTWVGGGVIARPIIVEPDGLGHRARAPFAWPHTHTHAHVCTTMSGVCG